MPFVIRSMNLDEWFFERLQNWGHTLLCSYTICYPEEDLDKHFADNLRKLQAKRTYGHSVKKLNFLHSIGQILFSALETRNQILIVWC